MPALPPELLDIVVYLYPDVASAEAGERIGGSGFVVFWPIQTDPYPMGFIYVVTNSHVVREGKSTVIRTNTRGGGFGIVKDTDVGWIHHPDGDDVAVLPMSFKYEESKVRGLAVEWFITKEKVEKYKIGPGDETFMVGRFVNHEGKQQNTPAVRFGNLSMMAHDPIRTQRGLLQEAFLVEARSLPGYSGSPVFLHPYPFNHFKREVVPPMLLGIDMGHTFDYGRVLDKHELQVNNRKVYVDPNWAVETNTGMSCVIPAWKIWELLNIDELVKSREHATKELEKERANSPK